MQISELCQVVGLCGSVVAVDMWINSVPLWGVMTVPFRYVCNVMERFCCCAHATPRLRFHRLRFVIKSYHYPVITRFIVRFTGQDSAAAIVNCKVGIEIAMCQ